MELLIVALLVTTAAAPEHDCPTKTDGRYEQTIHSSAIRSDPQLVLHAQRMCAAMRERCLPNGQQEFETTAWVRACLYSYGVRN